MTQAFKNSQEIAEGAVKQVLSLLPLYRAKLKNDMIKIWCKSDGSYVTSIDYVIQFFIKRYLRACGSNFHVIAEESFVNSSDNHIIPCVLKDIHAVDPKVTEDELFETMLADTITTKEPFWTLDPIDGTFGLLKFKAFSIALALIFEGRPEIGILGCPILNTKGEIYQIYSACRNEGTFVYEPHPEQLKRKRLISDQSEGSSGTLIYCEATMSSLNQKHSDTRGLIHKINRTPLALRIDSQYKYALVAENAASVFLRIPALKTSCKIWDHAAGSLILEEAGGIVTDGNGQKLDFHIPPDLQNNPIIIAAANPHLHKQILNHIR